MLKHNLLLFFRNIKKHKSSFLINLIGLSSGLACVLLVYLWISDELSIDTFHEHEKRLYQVLRHVPDGQGSLATYSSNSSLMLTALQTEVPEVEMATAVFEFDTGAMVKTDDKKLTAIGNMASEDYFKLFSYPLIHGSKHTVLKDINAVVISKEMARNFFGQGVDPMGKSLTIKHGEEGVDGIFTVTGVFDIPANSSKKFDFVLSYKKFLQRRDADNIHWGSNSSRMYALLNPDVHIDHFNNKMADFIKNKNEYNLATVFFTRYADNYLKGNFENGKQTGGRINYVILFSLVAIFVLAIACINFMNLSTARASRRLKEVGVKKAVGANRKVLIFQFLTESIVLSFFSLFCASVFVILILSWFNGVTGKDLVFSVDNNMTMALIAITLLTGLASGSYPALYLTKFDAAKVLKGKIKTSFGELLVRKGLVIFQFSISIFLIVAVSVIYMQLDFIQSKNLGYNKDNVMIFERQDGLVDNMETFLEQAKQIPGVVNASYMQGGMTSFNNSSSDHRWPGQTEASKKLTFRHAHVGPEFIETMGIEMKEGRSYISEKPNNDSKIILNETAVKLMGLKNPIGTRIDMRGPNREIIGVVKDFNIQSLYDEIAPMALLCRTEWVGTLMVKIKSGKEKATIAALTDLHNTFNPGLTFDFRFLDEQYQQLYESEQRVAILSKYFAGLAILISCLGLFGLAAFTAERRKKEISIRKVLGQSIGQVTVMLSSEFVKLVLISMLIALPIAYLLATNWLGQFAYRIPLKIWYFIGAGVAALSVAMFTVGSQAIRAANRNPINTLREE
ncbi:ABC transporter permease [Flagellimonas sp. HMM57]|uniref:ABC transporter permease n=1 Tax=unclassified Flagellimonas TaxID=2644544 RepID=UPI0013D0CE91|nr:MULTISPECIES: ABC transporter permease [unclassified Flagellimonas]UII77705.1 ABC transporter permease [Flagellimonas sp. HMM57]